MSVQEGVMNGKIVPDLPDLAKAVLQEAGRKQQYRNLLVCNSMSVDQEMLSAVQGLNYYEERCLVWLLYLNQPGVKLVYPSSEPIVEGVVEYFLGMLTSTTAQEARCRLMLAPCHDTRSDIPLSLKLMARPKLLQRIRRFLGLQPTLLCFNCTEEEVRLHEALGSELYACHPQLAGWGTKLGSRQALREAGVPHPRGSYHLSFNEDDLVDTIAWLVAGCKGELTQLYVKLNEGISGLGNAIFDLPDTVDLSPAGVCEVVRVAMHGGNLRPVDKTSSVADFLVRMSSTGAIVEELVRKDDAVHSSPSVQVHILPDGDHQVVSTHEQILAPGGVFGGAVFPAKEEYRRLLHKYGDAVARVLSVKGCRDRFAVDFIATQQPGGRWSLQAIEINLRWGGTTHPMMFLQMATGGQLNEGGVFQLPDKGACGVPQQGGHGESSGTRVYYIKDIKKDEYKGLTPADLLYCIQEHKELQYDKVAHQGLVFNVFGWLSEHGKLQVTSYAQDLEAAQNALQTAEQLLGIWVQDAKDGKEQ